MTFAKFNRLERGILLGVTLVNLLFLAMAATFMFTSHTNFEDRLNITAHNLARLLERNISAEVRSVNNAVRRVVLELNRQMAAGGIDKVRLEQLLASEESQLPEINAIRITDAAGNVLWGKGADPRSPASYADRAFFKSHRKHVTSCLIITEPIKERVSGIWVIAFTGCYHTVDGQFAGVASAAIPVDAFSKLINSLDVDKSGTVVLRYADMGLITRVPPIKGPAGEPGNKVVSKVFTKLVESGQAVATFHTAKTPDSVERTYAFRRVAGYPFTLSVGLVEDEFLSPWRTQTVWVSAMCVIFIFVTSVFGWILLQNLRERTAMQEARIRDMTRQRILIEHSKDGIIVLDREGVVCEANMSFLEMVGYSIEEVRQLHVWDWDRNWKHVQVFETDGQKIAIDTRFETIYRRKDGTTIDVEVSANEAVLEGQHLVFCVCRDIGESKRAQSALRESNERLQKVFDSQPDAIFVLTEAVPERIVTCNEAASKIFGYELKEMCGATTEKLHVDKKQLAKYQEVLRDAIKKEGSLRNFEFKMKRKDESTFPSEHTTLELKDDAGVRTGWISVVRDLTERKKAEARFQHAQKMESVGSLAGGIAHDFNNILFPIVGLAELLTEDLPPGSPENVNAQEILRAGKRGADLVRQILAFSRQQEHKSKPTRIQQVIKEVIKLTRSTIPTNVDIKHDLQSDCGVVLVDAVQLHQIGMNLITNAYHAVEERSGEILVQVKEVTVGLEDTKEMSIVPGKYAVLSISDNGVGIPQTNLTKIFDPYFTTKPQGKGTGLGLAVVYGIVKEHKGDIKIRSEVGKGTTIEIYFPLMVTQEISEPSIAQILAEGGTEHILLVDDESAIVNLEKLMLERLGYQITSFTSSLDAVEIFRSDPDAFDIVITDMTMPNMTGEQLSNEILSIKPNMPIIICTGFSERINKEQAESVGIKGFLMKPVVKSDMAQMVRKLLDKSQRIKAMH